MTTENDEGKIVAMPMSNLPPQLQALLIGRSQSANPDPKQTDALERFDREQLRGFKVVHVHDHTTAESVVLVMIMWKPK